MPRLRDRNLDVERAAIDDDLIANLRRSSRHVAGDDLNDLIAFRVHEVTPEYITNMAELGYQGISSSKLLAFRVHEVTHPHAFNWVPPAMISSQVVGRLALTGQDSITRPSLAERWEASDDLKTWTLHLRQGIKWHSGRDFTADDVMWNLEHVLDPETGSHWYR